MSRSVMADLETWGVRPGCALRSIGACVFDPKTGAVAETFYRNITRASCEDAGLKIEPSTEKWWDEKVSAEAKEALLADPISIASALKLFSNWWGRVQGTYFWSHGAGFDEVLLRHCFEHFGLDTPWNFWNVRCSRTVLALGNRKPNREGGVHHNALDDAIAQAKAVAAALRGGIKL